MKYIIVLIGFIGFLSQAEAQTFSCSEAENYTCYHLDSNNVHCYVEDSEWDLDLNNDGIMDREYIFSTPEQGEPMNSKDEKNKERGTIRNRNSEGLEDEEAPEVH